MEILQRTPEWFNARNGRVTASSVGAIMGYAPYATRSDIMRRMVRSYHNAPSEFNGNIATEYGNFNEDFEVFDFTIKTGLEVTPAPFVPYGDFMGASPDGYVSDGRLLEIKCPFGLRKSAEFKSIDDQKHYFAQIQMQLLATGYLECYFFQWSPHGTKTELVERDENFIKTMIDECQKFYNEYLIERELPNAEKYLDDKTKKVFDEDDLINSMREYQNFKSQKDSIDEKMKELLSKMVALTDGKGGIIDGHTLYKTERKGSVSYSKVIKDLLPDADLEPYRGDPSTSWSIR